MSQISLIEQIFNKYFVNLKEKVDDETLISLKTAFKNEGLLEEDFDKFIGWLENHNKYDKKP